MSHGVILFGIPINQEEYFLRIAESDYLKAHRSQPEKNWQDSYGNFVASPFHDLACKAAEGLDFEIRTGATLQDLKEVSQIAQVIVLVSHWKNYVFSNDDLAKPINEMLFLEVASRVDEPLAKWLIRAFRRSRIGNSNTPINWLESLKGLWETEQTVRDILEQALDVDLKNELPLIEGVSEVVESDLKRRTRRRDFMDNLFSNLIAPGNRLELFDGLYDCDTISGAINRNFQGVLDLTTCTSTILADHISRDHRYRFRVVQFSQNQEPIWAATVLQTTLTLLSQGYGYLDARQKSIQLVREVIQSRISKR